MWQNLGQTHNLVKSDTILKKESDQACRILLLPTPSSSFYFGQSASLVRVSKFSLHDVVQYKRAQCSHLER